MHSSPAHALFLCNPNTQCIDPKEICDVQAATIKGQLFSLPGNVPAILPRHGIVYGNVLLLRNTRAFEDTIERIQKFIRTAQWNIPLDGYKQTRVVTRTQNMQYKALAYIFTHSTYAEQHGTHVRSGRWPQHTSSCMRRVFIDADACPRDVLQTVLQNTSVYNYKLITIASYHHHIESPCHIVVDDGPDAADHAIMNRCRPGDVVITHDWGLASLVLSKQAYVISPQGTLYSEQAIDFMLAERFVKAKVRRAGLRTSGPKARTPNDQHRFERAFCRLMNTLNHAMT